MPIEPSKKRRKKPRLVATLGRLDRDFHCLRLSRLKADGPLVTDVCPPGGMAFSRSRAGEGPAAAAADLRLLLDHCAVEVRTVARNNLKQFHWLPPDSRSGSPSIVQRGAIVEHRPICYSASFPTRWP